MVLLQGDTTTAMAAALAAFYLRVPVGHVEAGLRSFDRHNPFPEEINRRIASALGDLHFAPTEKARANLLAEGVPPEAVFVTGNTIVDALRRIHLTGEFATPALRDLPLAGRRLLVVTAHRRENHGPPLHGICRALRRLAEKFADVVIVYPVHLNPSVRRAVNADLGGVPTIRLLAPLPYPDLLRLLARSELILTDSGGIQEEAPSLGKPVLVLRETTERPELIEGGAGKLVGTDPDRIVAEATLLLTDRAAYDRMVPRRNPFGDGHAAERIVRILAERCRG
jgi:UDP-N-acetylglucosamine 2-epimerase (non-hydrolysing)